MTIWHPRQTWHFFISAVYHTECMLTHPILLGSTILDFWTPNFKATVISTFVVHLLWKSPKWLKTCWKNVVCSFVEFLHAFLKLCPTKSCATFLDHPIYNANSNQKIMVMYHPLLQRLCMVICYKDSDVAVCRCFGLCTN